MARLKFKEYLPKQVIMYSVSLRCWEVWGGGRPVAHGSLESCQAAYPDAVVGERQRDLAARDQAGEQ